jgi:2-phospho-L-lactate/phosphoenolpyruvate guanylyltransferase
MQATVADFDPLHRTGRVLLDDGSAATFGPRAFDASGLRLLRSGQRLRVRLAPDGTVAALGLPTLPLPED